MSVTDIETSGGGWGSGGEAAYVPTGRLGYVSGVLTIFRMELIQRMRTRAWSVLLGVWLLVVTGSVALLGSAMQATKTLQEAAARQAEEQGLTDVLPSPLLALHDVSIGQVQFELAACFVLVCGAFIAPVLAANAISGDRAAGTLAVVQATLVSPGQILWGKWLASWAVSLCFLAAAIPAFCVAAAAGLSDWSSFWLVLASTIVEFGVLCALGVGISALTARPLFSILVSYLVVGALFGGTVVAAALGSAMVTQTVSSSQEDYTDAQLKAMNDWNGTGPNPMENAAPVCGAKVTTSQQPATDRFAWLLAANPAVLVADLAVPPATIIRHDGSAGSYDNQSQIGPFGAVSTGVRSMQAGPQAQVRCLAGKLQPVVDLDKQPPVWPLGLAVQGVLVAGVVLAGRRRLVTPAGRLASGTRVA